MMKLSKYFFFFLIFFSSCLQSGVVVFQNQSDDALIVILAETQYKEIKKQSISPHSSHTFYTPFEIRHIDINPKASIRISKRRGSVFQPMAPSTTLNKFIGRFEKATITYKSPDSVSFTKTKLLGFSLKEEVSLPIIE